MKKKIPGGRSFRKNGRGIGLNNRLIAYKGITGEDIALRNSNFYVYIYTLRDLGYLPMED
ncbi:MAG: hypothetical protein K0R00_4208 [Herbinix sp.]|nr:hypothetical protein [Herbinix sp.]